MIPSETTSEIIWGAPLSTRATGHVLTSPQISSVFPSRSEIVTFRASFGEAVAQNGNVRLRSINHVIGNVASTNQDIPNRFSSSTQSESKGSASSVSLVPSNWEIYERCRKRFVQITVAEEIEYGLVAPSEVLLGEYFERYGSLIGNIVQHIYLNEIGNKSVLIALLKSLSTRAYRSVYPYAQTIAVAALASHNVEVREAGVRAFENWGHSEGIGVLKELIVTPRWLDEYRVETIEYLETLA